MVGELVRRKRTELGLTQPELALKAGLRQTYISQVETGEIAMPRDHNLDALGRALGISRAEFYREAGYLEGVEGSEEDPSPPRVVVVHGPSGDLEVPIDEVVAYVESFPDQRQRDRLARWRADYDVPTYQRLCARTFVAWHSNLGLVLGALEEADVS